MKERKRLVHFKYEHLIALSPVCNVVIGLWFICLLFKLFMYVVCIRCNIFLVKFSLGCCYGFSITCQTLICLIAPTYPGLSQGIYLSFWSLKGFSLVMFGSWIFRWTIPLSRSTRCIFFAIFCYIQDISHRIILSCICVKDKTIPGRAVIKFRNLWPNPFLPWFYMIVT